MNTAKYFEKKDNQDNVVFHSVYTDEALCKVVLGVAIQNNNNIIVIFPMLN